MIKDFFFNDPSHGQRGGGLDIVESQSAQLNIYELGQIPTKDFLFDDPSHGQRGEGLEPMSALILLAILTHPMELSHKQHT